MSDADNPDDPPDTQLQEDLDLLSDTIEVLEETARNGQAMRIGKPGVFAEVLSRVLKKAYPGENR
jgi:hypothetical protein